MKKGDIVEIIGSYSMYKVGKRSVMARGLRHIEKYYPCCGCTVPAGFAMEDDMIKVNISKRRAK